MANPIRPLAVSLLLAAAGCSLIVDPEAKDPLASAEGFCNSIQDVWVDLAIGCGEVDASYAEQLFMQLRPGCENTGTAEDQGRFGYDRDIAEQCIAMLEASGCTFDIWSTFQFCALALPGMVPPGGACDSQFSMLDECAGNGTCYAGATCPGTCVVPGNVGESCSPAGCAVGLVCDGANRCAVPGGYGESCTGLSPPCDSAWYYCDTGSGTCQSLAWYVGQVCSTTDFRCVSGLACAWDGVSSYLCMNPAVHGADCAVTAYMCVAGDYCRPDDVVGGYRCWTIPTGVQGVGGDCNHSGASCGAGLYCDSLQNNTCQPVLPAGATCTDWDQCGRGSTCSKLGSEATGTCVRLKPNGSPCRAGAGECLDGLACMGTSAGSPGVCRPYGGTGATCGNPYYAGGFYNEDVDCAIGYFCNQPSGFVGTCAPVVPVGGSCLVGGVTQNAACGGMFSSAVCDTTNPAAPVCATNACYQLLGWFPGFG